MLKESLQNANGEITTISLDDLINQSEALEEVFEEMVCLSIQQNWFDFQRGIFNLSQTSFTAVINELTREHAPNGLTKCWITK